MKVVIEVTFKKAPDVSPETLFYEIKKAAYQLAEELDCIVLDSKLTQEYETNREFYDAKRRNEC